MSEKGKQQQKSRKTKTWKTTWRLLMIKVVCRVEGQLVLTEDFHTCGILSFWLLINSPVNYCDKCQRFRCELLDIFVPTIRYLLFCNQKRRTQPVIYHGEKEMKNRTKNRSNEFRTNCFFRWRILQIISKKKKIVSAYNLKRSIRS